MSESDITQYSIQYTLYNTRSHFWRKMPPKVGAWRPGKIVEITYHEVDSKLRLDDSLGTSSAHCPILISSEGNVRETIEHHK